MYKIVPITDAHRPFIDARVAEFTSGPFIVTRGVLHDTRTHAGFAAVEDGLVVGYILYIFANGECEITVLESLRERQGIASSLIREAERVARENACSRVWLVTTNDNTHAIRFYQKYGFTLRAVHINAMEESRRLKPHIPPTGDDGIPIAHEFEFELTVN